MHPLIIQAAAAERIRERNACAAAARQARWVRQSRRGLRAGRAARGLRAAQGPAMLPAPRET
jgi:hypothetical protein